MAERKTVARRVFDVVHADAHGVAIANPFPDVIGNMNLMDVDVTHLGNGEWHLVATYAEPEKPHDDTYDTILVDKWLT